MLAGPIVWLVLASMGNPVNLARLPLLEYSMLVILYPVLEEWIFRGNILPTIAAKLPAKMVYPPISLANLLTSLIFVALHLFSHPPLWAASVILPSLVFGWAMERYKILAAPIILHMFYNAGYFLLFA